MALSRSLSWACLRRPRYSQHRPPTEVWELADTPPSQPSPVTDMPHVRTRQQPLPLGRAPRGHTPHPEHRLHVGPAGGASTDGDASAHSSAARLPWSPARPLATTAAKHTARAPAPRGPHPRCPSLRGSNCNPMEPLPPGPSPGLPSPCLSPNNEPPNPNTGQVADPSLCTAVPTTDTGPTRGEDLLASGARGSGSTGADPTSYTPTACGLLRNRVTPAECRPRDPGSRTCGADPTPARQLQLLNSWPSPHPQAPCPLPATSASQASLQPNGGTR